MATSQAADNRRKNQSKRRKNFNKEKKQKN